MRARVPFRPLLLVTLATGLLAAGSDAAPPARPAIPPRLEAVAETHLLMEGLAEPNLRGIERILKEKPADANAWVFARGQALLIAETGNLLLIRPPHNAGEAVWQDRSMAMRQAATDLAKSVGVRDYESSRARLVVLATACNRCHQSFRVEYRARPFAEPKEGDRSD